MEKETYLFSELNVPQAKTFNSENTIYLELNSENAKNILRIY